MLPQDKPANIPTEPGVYRWRDASGKIIYVGKAKNLRSRLSSYFTTGLQHRTQIMVSTATTVDWVTVATEIEALQLEYAWIKQFDPHFNVRYRDDKTYPYLALSTSEEFPRAFVFRGEKRKGNTYFGPYVQVWAIRDTLDHLLRVFPVRSCTNGVFRNAKAAGRPCLLAHIDRCSAPCVGRISAEDHGRIAKNMMTFLGGQQGTVIKDIKAKMIAASDAQDFERAAVLRDDLAALERVAEKSAMVLPDDTMADLVAVVHDDLQSAVQIFSIRNGRITGQRGFIMENPVEATDASLVTDALMHIYSNTHDIDIPREVLTNVLPQDAPLLIEMLSELRGSAVDLRVPQRGDKHALVDTVAGNAEQQLTRHKLKRSADLTTRSIALSEIQEAVGLTEAPLRIECIDVSHISGTNVVASLVVFEDGLPRTSDYRRYIIENPRDDTASIFEVVQRRFRKDSDVATRAYRPSLLVIDGGQPQVNAATHALNDLGITDIPVVGLAKRMEELWPAGENEPVILPRNSEGLFMLQRLRDEAHRFAITLHRSRRSKSMIDSLLDDVEGVGPAKKKALIKHFGSLKKLKLASASELQEVPGIGPKQANALLKAFTVVSQDAVAPAVNMTTGEILEE